MPTSLLRVSCLSLTSIAALAGPALAEDAPAPAAPVMPLAFPTLGADGLDSHLTVQLGYQRIDGADTGIKRLDLSGQFVGNGNAGGYASFAVYNAGDTTTMSNLELGAVFHLKGRTTDTGLRAGVVLPTASDDDDTFLGFISTELARPSDFVTSVPNVTTLRLAAAPTYRSGQLVLRADVGLDFAIATEGSDGPEALYHVDVAAGYDSGSFGLTGELQTLGSTDSEASGSAHVFAVTAQGRRGKVTPFATLSIPFFSGNDSEFDALNLFGGIRFGG